MPGYKEAQANRSPLRFERLRKRAIQYAKQMGWATYADDFGQYACLTLHEGRNPVLPFLLVDFLRAERGSEKTMKGNQRLLTPQLYKEFLIATLAPIPDDVLLRKLLTGGSRAVVFLIGQYGFEIPEICHLFNCEPESVLNILKQAQDLLNN